MARRAFGAKLGLLYGFFDALGGARQSRLDFNFHAFNAVIEICEPGFDAALYGTAFILGEAALFIDVGGELPERIFQRFHGRETLHAAIVFFKRADFFDQGLMRLAQFVDHGFNFCRHRRRRVFCAF